MKNNIIIVMLLAINACTNQKDIYHYYSDLENKNIKNFIGYKFICDSIGDLYDIKPFILSMGLKVDSNELIYPDIVKIKARINSKLEVANFNEFSKKPFLDSSIKFTKNELIAFSEIQNLSLLQLNDTTNKLNYAVKIDSLAKSMEFNNYLDKDASRKKILLIFYPVVNTERFLIISYRMYHTRLTSDAGSIVSEIFYK